MKPSKLKRGRTTRGEEIVDDDPKLPSLPIDIIHEVLLRLPAKSILKFRCASKLLNELSTAPDFILAHTQCFRENSHLLPASLAVYQTNGSRLLVLGGTEKTHFITTKKKPIDLKKHKSCFQMKQFVDIDYVRTTCDGLLCFGQWGTESSYVIVNPLTRECSAVSLSEYKERHVDDKFLGFYYHASSSQYRLLLNLHTPNVYAIVTIGPNTVRTIENSCNYEPYFNGGIMLVDTVYFFGRNYGSYDGLVVAFNVEDEQFKVLPVPGHSYHSGFDQLVVIEGKLCICRIIGAECMLIRAEMWVLVDCKVGEWIKKKHVNVEIIEGQKEGYNFVSSACKKFNKFVLMKSGINVDIASPDKILNLYILEAEAMFDKDHGAVYSCVQMYGETLVAIDR